MEIAKAHEKRIVLSAKKKTASQNSQSALKGMAIKSKDTIPVPIVTENHDGEKFLTTRRHPTCVWLAYAALQ